MGASQGKVSLREAFNTLQRNPMSATDHFWEQLIESRFNIEELFATLRPSDVRALHKNQPLNLRIILEQTTGYCRSYLTSESDDERPDVEHVRNSLLILSRLLPFVLEKHEDAETEAQVAQLFWTAAVHGAGAGDAASYDRLPLAAKIMHASTALLFNPGFGLQPRPTTRMDSIINPSGLAGIVPVPSDNDCSTENCTAALRTLLTCFCETLYAESDVSAIGAAARISPSASRWLQWARSPANTLARPLFTVLLNAVLGPGSEPVGYGVPYAYILSDIQSREYQTCASLHVLLLLLDDSAQPSDGQSTAENVFLSEMINLPDWPDGTTPGNPAEGQYAKILQGLERILGQASVSEASYLPGSMRPLRCAEEAMVLLWQFLRGNTGFRSYTSSRAGPITVAVCSFIYRHRTEAAKVGVLNVCVFILLLLSGERAYCVGLNHPLADAGPPELKLVVGSSPHSDILLMALCQLMDDGHPLTVASQFEICLTIVCNVSAFVKAVAQQATLNLLSLFDRVARPIAKSVKEQADTPPATGPLLILLETFDNMLQYQGSGNARLTFGLTTRQAFLHSLVPPAEPPAAQQLQKMGEKLNAILRLVDGLRPLIEGFCTESIAAEEGAAEEDIVQFLKDTTLVGLLPVPHPILCRKYQPGPHTGMWFTTFLWGAIYTQHLSPPLFDAGAIRLFRVAYTDDEPAV